METTNHGICKVTVAPLRAEANDRAEIVSQLLFGDYAEVLELNKPWVKVRMNYDKYEGWMDFKQLKYISAAQYQKETEIEHPVIPLRNSHLKTEVGRIDLLAGSQLPNFQDKTVRLGDEIAMVDVDFESEVVTPVLTAIMFRRVPYLWGGRSTYGIDCSGYTQTVGRIHGIKVPRDASDQVHVGEVVAFEDRQPGDIPFFVNEEGHVHHVGILISEDRVLHASGWVRGDKFDQEGIYREDFGEYTHKLHSIRRWFKE